VLMCCIFAVWLASGLLTLKIKFPYHIDETYQEPSVKINHLVSSAAAKEV